MAFIKLETGDVLVNRVRVARTHWQKFKGLMLSRSLREDEALMILRCKSIHCCFMLMPIDVLFVAHDGHIVHLISQMKPWRFSKYIRAADFVLECYPGTIERFQLKVGERIRILSPEAVAAEA